MLSGRTFQREGMTYLKVHWPYHFVLESLGLGPSRRDLDDDLRRHLICVYREDQRGRGGYFPELTGMWHR